ncbi:MAG: hypothetical protein AVDCRST_MAG47-2422, partial [uncultured Nocardioidaceae bacterium]
FRRDRRAAAGDHARRTDVEERQDRLRDPRPAELPQAAPTPGAQPGRRQGRAHRGQGRDHAGHEDRPGDPHLPRGRQRHERRGADHGLAPQAPGQPGHQPACRGGRRHQQRHRRTEHRRLGRLQGRGPRARPHRATAGPPPPAREV